MAIKIYPYKQGSRSARLLADTIGGRVLRLEGSRYQPRPGDLVINWGNSDPAHPAFGAILTGKVLNKTESIRTASNKLNSFCRLSLIGASVPNFWADAQEIPDDAFPICCRTILNGHSGAGIVIADTRSDLVNAPLYVQYVKKLEEFRVHVVDGEVIFIQRKARRHDAENVDYRVRNLANGFNFVLSDVADPRLNNEAINAVSSLGLDFGAVDIIYNQRQDRYYVLEVNCAPGLEQRTADMYAEAFRKLV